MTTAVWAVWVAVFVGAGLLALAAKDDDDAVGGTDLVLILTGSFSLATAAALIAVLAQGGNS